MSERDIICHIKIPLITPIKQPRQIGTKDFIHKCFYMK